MANEGRDATKPVEARGGRERWASCVRGATCVWASCVRAHVGSSLQGVIGHAWCGADHALCVDDGASVREDMQMCRTNNHLVVYALNLRKPAHIHIHMYTRPCGPPVQSRRVESVVFDARAARPPTTHSDCAPTRPPVIIGLRAPDSTQPVNIILER